jgi:hypothetical protein
MVRATAAEVLKLLGGTYPAGFNATNVGNMCAEADYELDDFALANYNTTLSTTDTAVISIANNVVVRKVIHAQWLHAPIATRGPEPEIFTQHIRDRIEAHLGSTTYDGFYTGDMVADD